MNQWHALGGLQSHGERLRAGGAYGTDENDVYENIGKKGEDAEKWRCVICCSWK